MPMPSVALINGYRYQHASFRARIFGLLVRGLKEFNFKHAIERGKVMGTARESLASTKGNVSYEASCTVYRAEWDALKEHARTSFGIPVMDVQGDFVITYGERGQPSKTVHVRFNGINEADTTSSAGVDATEVKLVFDVAFIKEDGKAMVEDSIY